MKNFFKRKVAEVVQVVEDGYPSYVKRHLYEYDEETEHLLSYILDHGVCIDVDDGTYAYFLMPSKKVFEVWIYGAGYGCRARTNSGASYDKDLWDDSHASVKTQKRLYDITSVATVPPKKTQFESYEKNGMFLKMNRYGEEHKFYKGSVPMDEPEWTKELAVWLLTNK